MNSLLNGTPSKSPPVDLSLKLEKTFYQPASKHLCLKKPMQG